MAELHGKALTFDFGGTKLAGAIVDKTNGDIRYFARRQTPRSLGSQGSLDVIYALGDEILKKNNGDEVQVIGISFGGPITRDCQMIIKSQHVEGWDYFPLPEVLSEHFGLPVFMENDANAAALGEWYFGAGERCDSLFYVQVSTGIGAGIVIDGKIYRGMGMAGEFGHLTIEDDGLQCACGKLGCLESYSSGWGIASRARNIYPSLKDGSALRQLTMGKPENVTTELVFEAYRQSDQDMRALVHSAMASLARCIADTVCILDPERVVIGGGVARSRDIMEAEIMPYLEKYIPKFIRPHFDLRFSVLDGNETLCGAALLSEARFR